MENILLSCILTLALIFPINAFAQNKKSITQKKVEQTKTIGDKQVRKKRRPVLAELQHANMDKKTNSNKKSGLKTKTKINISKDKKQIYPTNLGNKQPKE